MNISLNKGKRGEIVAKEYLLLKGYEILETNYHSRYGEIDIVAKIDEELVFCEVKTFKKNSFVSPLEAVDDLKLQKIKITIEDYINKKDLYNVDCRIDVVVVGNNVVLEHLKHC
jgi:putative endonuclease